MGYLVAILINQSYWSKIEKKFDACNKFLKNQGRKHEIIHSAFRLFPLEKFLGVIEDLSKLLILRWYDIC